MPNYRIVTIVAVLLLLAWMGPAYGLILGKPKFWRKKATPAPSTTWVKCSNMAKGWSPI